MAGDGLPQPGRNSLRGEFFQVIVVQILHRTFHDDKPGT